MQAMSAISRFFRGIGWISRREDDTSWGNRPPFKPADRRLSFRYPGCGRAAYLGWWKDGKLHTAVAHFRDISSGGAMVLTQVVPPDEHIWVSFVNPAGVRWCPAKVVRVKETSVGLVEVGLAFQAPRNSDFV